MILGVLQTNKQDDRRNGMTGREGDSITASVDAMKVSLHGLLLSIMIIISHISMLCMYCSLIFLLFYPQLLQTYCQGEKSSLYALSSGACSTATPPIDPCAQWDVKQMQDQPVSHFSSTAFLHKVRNDFSCELYLHCLLSTYLLYTFHIPVHVHPTM